MQAVGLDHDPLEGLEIGLFAKQTGAPLPTDSGRGTRYPPGVAHARLGMPEPCHAGSFFVKTN